MIEFLILYLPVIYFGGVLCALALIGLNNTTVVDEHGQYYKKTNAFLSWFFIIKFFLFN